MDSARDRLDQAKTLFALNTHRDIDYLERHIRDESFGGYDIDDIKT